MFSSIKWRFIVVYFLLVFIAMAIVGAFIVNRLEAQQLENVTVSMKNNIEAISYTSSYFTSDNWLENQEQIQNTLNDWRLAQGETIYAIYDEDVPKIIATSSREDIYLIGKGALSNKFIDPKLVIDTFSGVISEAVLTDELDGKILKHIAYPIYSTSGKISGVLYMTSDLSTVESTLSYTRSVLTRATMIALSTTILLGFLIANSITEPIRDVTRKAFEMTQGNFNQYVSVKSNDEIGQLANMFNQLTLKLNETLNEMELEKNKLDTIFSYMAEGVIAIDKNGELIHANPIGKKLLSIENIEIDNGKNILDLSKLGLLGISYKDETTLNGEKLIEISGNVYKVKYAPYRNENQSIEGLIIVYQDITQEHNLDKMRKEFVANVSHELKTPITTIKSYTETLMIDDVDEAYKKKFLTVIDEECDRMSRLVSDLLQLSNIDYKKTKWNKEKLYINEIIEDIISKLKIMANEKNISMTFNSDKNYYTYADKDGLIQVFQNIIINSIKYTENNGYVKVNMTKEDPYVVVEIIDNGIGIPKEDIDRVFDRFYRVEKGRSRDLGGTGLGLSIAKEIIEAFDGKIQIESENLTGTIVKIKLPLLEEIIQESDNI
ncbi:cell wall metabolism sensor histidine kinase WalK [Soehngenia longivitae]|uniref:histidine kinase n=1 Tax=Soehngenia longivitae TaxID=2562294 RepID=A0A4Z0D8W4_9FIRM|nr:ATP-binding protein [Soehngenia longivitae]TFZ41320.1 cell wall metabolism sensor histidine kinase WalK [Soehngenia longivitae]